MLLGCKKNDFINILISLLKTIKQKENHQETLFTETYQTHISFSFKLENLLRTRRVSSFWSLCWNFPPFLKTQPSFTKQRTVLEHRIQTCSLTSDPCVHSQVAHSQYPVSSKRSEKGLKNSSYATTVFSMLHRPHMLPVTFSFICIFKSVFANVF